MDADRGRQRHDRHVRREAVRAGRRRRSTEDSRYYEFNGECVAMDRRTLPDRRRGAARAARPARRTSSSSARSTGRCSARGKIGDMPVAVSQQALDLPARSSTRRSRSCKHEPQRGADRRRLRPTSSTSRTTCRRTGATQRPRDRLRRTAACTRARPAAADPDLPGLGHRRVGVEQDATARTSTSAARRSRTRSRPSATTSCPGTTARRRAGAARDAQWGWSSIYRGRPARGRDPRGERGLDHADAARADDGARGPDRPARAHRRAARAAAARERAGRSARASADGRRCCASGSTRARCAATATRTATTTTRRPSRSWTRGGSR